MTTKEKKIALLAEQKANYKDLKSKIDNLSNPTAKDIDYLQGIMKGKKYNRDNRTELTNILDEMEAMKTGSKSTVTFKTEEPETESQKKVSDTVKEAVKLTRDEVMGTSQAPMTDRAKMFNEVREELLNLADKCLKYSRKSTGGTAMRLAQTSNELNRIAKSKLRD